MVLAIAKEYGQSPDDVENKWSMYWRERAALKLQGEALYHKREIDRLKSKR